MSIFLDRKNTGPVISFLFLEYLGVYVSDNPKSSVEEAVVSAYQSAYQHTPKTEYIVGIATRLQKREEDRVEKDEKTDHIPVKRKNLGTMEMDWVEGLGPDKLCIYLADFNYAEATNLYCTIDYEAVTKMAELKQQARWNIILSEFEACMYGFGGSYKGGTSETDKDHSLEVTESGSMSKKSVEALQNLGF